MKKRHLQERIDSLTRVNRVRQEQDSKRHEKEQAAFDAALTDITSSRDNVLIITGSGKLLRAVVIDVEASTAMIDVGNGFIPGLREVTIKLAPQPGLEM